MPTICEQVSQISPEESEKILCCGGEPAHCSPTELTHCPNI